MISLPIHRRRFPFLLRRLFNSHADILQEGDRALLRYRDKTILTKPLRRKGETSTAHGTIGHESIIGKRSREAVKSAKGITFRTHFPTLEEYVTMTPRVVTPVYPKDANLMVSLLDIHVSPQLAPPQKQHLLEILEAGTGHGGLTLYLARAIHAANIPRQERKDTVDTNQDGEPRSSRPDTSLPADESSTNTHVALSRIAAEKQELLDEMNKNKLHRRAVVHTVEISPNNLAHAQKIVKGFRRGQYAEDVVFYVGDVAAWIDQQIASRKQPNSGAKNFAFLSHIILDLPNSYYHLQKATSALHVNGSILVFNPSVTQIVACVEEVRKRRLPLELDRVVELGPAMTGGREWDVRAVRPKAVLQADMRKANNTVDPLASTTTNCPESQLIKDVSSTKTGDEEEAEAALKEETGWEIVCRPMVGDRVSGGGFLGVWKKMEVQDH